MASDKMGVAVTRTHVLIQDSHLPSFNSPFSLRQVLKLSQFLLLQTAADDAIIRLRKSTLSHEEIKCLTSWYFKHQYHTSIGEFLQYECSHNREVFMQVTTHCPLMTHEELSTVTNSVGMDFAHFDLHKFDSELDFSNKIGPKFLRDDTYDAKPFLVIIQCDSGHLNSDLIACARYRVCDEAIQAKVKNKIRGHDNIHITHILFVIRLPQQEVKSQFVGFQGDPWISVHIDDLRSTSEITVIPEQALNASISELFIGRLNERQELHYDSGSQSGMEIGSEDEMSHSAEHGQRMNDEDFYSDQDMSDDEVSVKATPQLSTLEEVNRLDTEIDGSLFGVPEPVYRDSAVNEEELMDIEDVQVFDPLLTGVALPPVEMMQADNLAGNTMQISSPTNNFTKAIDSSLPTIPIQHSGDDITEPTPRPMNADPVAEVLDSFEGEVPCQEDKLCAERMRQVKASGSFHPQHQRLLGCVQAAVSMLKDSQRDRAMHRIQKLTALLPKLHPVHLGEAPFYDLLVQFIYSALLQRERDRVDERDWVLNEAMSGRKLQNGGTFRNVLARRIDEVIIPYFAEIIAHADQNCNLDLLDPKDLDSPVSRLWLTIFKFTGGRIDFSSLAEGKTTIKTDFHCQFPFSWFVRDTVDAQRASMLIGNEQQLHYSLCEALSLTDIGTFLDSVEEDHVDKLYKLYLHDFVRYIHKSSLESELSKMEYMLIMDALDAVTHREDFCSVGGIESLTCKIVALHLVHGQCSSDVLRFGQLVLYRPGILRSLSNKDAFRRAGEDFALHLYAVQMVLELDQEDDDPTSQYLAGLNPPLQKPNQGNVTRDIQRWLNHVRLSQNVIDTILRSSSGNDAAIKSRLTWQRIKALQIFAEKVYLPHCKVDGMLFIIKRLEIKLKKHSDFLKKVTLDEVKQLLNSMFSAKKLKADNTIKLKMRKNCNRFFIEVVSSLCFGGVDAPEPELIKLLLDTVLQDTKTSRLSPYNEQDETPTIRSFLLQLLLEHEPYQVKLYLDEYFQRSIEVIKGHGMDQGLFLLCIQCFEDALRKRVSVLSVDRQAREVGQILEKAYLALQKHLHACTPIVSLQYLEAVAEIRLALSVLAEQLKSDRVNNTLLKVARDMCMDTRVNVIDPTGRVDATGPVLYLMKLIVRQFGFPCLQTVCQAQPWVIPEGLRKTDNVEKSIDFFVLYEQGYKDVRIAVNTALFTNETAELTTCVQNGTEVCLLASAFYQKVTLSRASIASEEIKEEALQTLDTVIQDYPEISPEMLQVLRLLLANQQGGTLAQMVVSPHQAHAGLHRSLTGLVVHTVAVLLSRAKTKLLFPFLNMLTNPTALENAYLPTMPEDILQEVRQAGGTFYECPKGHPYLVGECGQPAERTTCLECGASIGGINYQLLADNKTARLDDTTKTGYDLGAPQQRTVNAERERNLSATAVSIVRVLMHASFLWAACHDQQLEVIAEVVKVVRPQDLAEFFWFHLEKDLECMQRSTGKGVDDCVMIMHLVLKKILDSNPLVCKSSNVNQLQSKTARKEWEQLFNSSYIEPVLNQLEVVMAKALDLVANDNQQEHDCLFYLAYEKVKVDEGKLEAHLWTYRPQINMEHLKNTVQAGNECKILDTFLQIEPSLRATQYIPDIVKLQQFMFETFDRRLDKIKAETMTIREFLEEVKDTRNENIKNECQDMIENLKKAWALVGQRLKNHSHDVSLYKYIVSRRMGKKPFSAKAKEHCTLGHILSLWETISVELARQLWHTGQEPFERIPEGYSADLSTVQLNELNKCLRTFDLVLLLGRLFEFIEVHVKHITANEENFPLVESLVLYWDRTEQVDPEQLLVDQFPGSITVPQAVATWKHVTEYKGKKH